MQGEHRNRGEQQ